MVWVLAGGGTGGHLYPALALAATLKAKGLNIHPFFFGAKGRLEETVVPKYGYPLLTIPARPFPHRWLSHHLIPSLASLASGFLFALRSFCSLRPLIVLGTGGYASVCALLAGKVVGAKLILFEANTIPGRANRLLSHFADFIATGFPEAVPFFPPLKANYTGTPIRPEFREKGREEARRALKLDPETSLLLVMGGSQGARRLNETLWEALPDLLRENPSLQVIHLCGRRWEGEAQKVREGLTGEGRRRYRPLGFHEDMPTFLHAADIALSRAGSSSIAEILVAGVPSILVPYPYAIYDHQRFNALSVARRGAAEMILEAELSGERLRMSVRGLLRAKEQRVKMREAALSIAKPYAAEEIVERVFQLLGG